MSTLLEIRGLVRRFGGLTAVDHVDLDVREGEFVSVIGPNGAGKTTLFNLVPGLDEPDGGTVHLEGRDITGPGGRPAGDARHGADLPARPRLRQSQRPRQRHGPVPMCVFGRCGRPGRCWVRSRNWQWPWPAGIGRRRRGPGCATVHFPSCRDSARGLLPRRDNPAYSLSLRQSAPRRDRPRAGAGAAAAAARRADRRHEPDRDRRDAGADRRAEGRGAHDPADRAQARDGHAAFRQGHREWTKARSSRPVRRRRSATIPR